MKKGTRQVDSCTNCMYCLDASNWDNTDFYCLLNTTMPTAYGNGDTSDQAIEEWYDWTEANSVWPSLICDNWSKIT